MQGGLHDASSAHVAVLFADGPRGAATAVDTKWRRSGEKMSGRAFFQQCELHGEVLDGVGFLFHWIRSFEVVPTSNRPLLFFQN